MFEHTKHDLSGGEVTIDWQSLIEVSKIALGECSRDLQREVNTLQSWETKPSGVVYASHEIEKLGKYLSIVSETLYALEEGVSKERPELKVINR
jgi:hypothetical protein